MTFSSEEEDEEDEDGEENTSIWLTSVFVCAAAGKESDLDLDGKQPKFAIYCCGP